MRSSNPQTQPYQLRSGVPQHHNDPVRNELYDGAQMGQYGEPEPELGPDGQPTIDQLVREADHTHKDTTSAARRALRVVNQTLDVQNETMKTLENQGKQLNRVNDRLNQVNQDLTYSEKILRYMRRCCCCWMCDSCTGADPEDQMKRKWEKQVDKGLTAKNDNAAAVVRGRGERGPTPPQGKAAGPSAPAATNGGPRYRDPDIRLTEQHQAKELELNAETRKQNEVLDEIHDGLGRLLNNARVIGEELHEQNRAAANLEGRFETTHGRIKEVNTKSQLREFRIK